MSTGNSGGSAKARKKPVPPKPFVKGDPRINRKGRPPTPPEVREAMRLANIELVQALTELVKKGEKKRFSERINLGLQLLDRINGPSAKTGWSNEPPEPLQTSPTAPPASAAIDLGEEIKAAREKHLALERKLKELGEDAPAALRKECAGAAELVRKLVATQAEVNPGGDIQGDFSVSVGLPAGEPGDAVVPDLVAAKQLSSAPSEVVQEKPTEPAEKTLDDVEDDVDG